MITTLDGLISHLRVKLPDYLAHHGIDATKKFTCLDPNHADKTPSASIYNGTFVKCFSCSAPAMDIFTVANILEGKPLAGEDFISENVMHLARLFSVDTSAIQGDSSKYVSHAFKYNYIKAHKVVAEYLQEVTDQSPSDAFVKEIRRRKWAEKSSIKLGVVGGTQFQNIRSTLKAAGFTDEFIKTAGLFRSDIFNVDSVIFTIYDDTNSPIAFYSRDTKYEEKRAEYDKKDFSNELIKEKAPIKYNSSANCPGVYEKKLFPYGIQDVKNFHKIIAVEGHGCRHNLKLSGFNNVIALGGLELSNETLQKLISFGVTNIVLFLDNDAKGIAKIKSIINTHFGKLPIDFTILDISEYSDIKDPDELIRKHGCDAIKLLQELHCLEWLAIKEIEQNQDQYATASILAGLIANERSPVTRLRLITNIANILDIPSDILNEEVDQKISNSQDRKSEFAIKVLDEAKDLIKHNPNALNAAMNLIESRLVDLNKNDDNSELMSTQECLRSIMALKEREESGKIEPTIKTGFPLFDKYSPLPTREAFCLIVASPNAGKCVNEFTEILCSDGIYRTIGSMRNDWNNHRIITMGDDHKLYTSNIDAFYDSGIIDTYEIKTKDGIFTKPSSTHPYYTLNGWKTVSELNIGDKIAISRNYSCFDNIDNDITHDDAILLGLYCSDGSNSNGQGKGKNGFTNVDNELINLFKTIVSKKMPNASFRLDKFTTYVSNKVDKNIINSFLISHDLFGCTAHTKKIPDSIFGASKAKIANFLGAFYACDGWICEKTKNNKFIGFEIGLSLCNLKMITQVRSLLLRFGIKCNIKESTSSYTGSDKRFNRYSIVIGDIESALIFKNNITIPLSEKQNKLNNIITKCNMSEFSKRGSYNNRVPNEIVKIIKDKCILNDTTLNAILIRLFGEQCKKGCPTYKIKPNSNLSYDLVRKIGIELNDSFLISIADGDIYFDTIVSKEYIGKTQCYDLTINETHNFIANDFVAHNTAMLLSADINVLDNNEDAMVVAYTNDDSRDVYFNRLVAIISKMPIKWIERPSNYLDEEKMQIREEAFKKVMDWIITERLIIKDVSHGSTVEYYGKLISYYRNKYPNRNIYSTCDNLHRLHTEMSSDGERERIKYISSMIKSYTTKYNCVCMCTVEMTKFNMYERVTDPNSIAETGSLQYDANLIIFLWNEINSKRDEAIRFFNYDSLEYVDDHGYVIKHTTGPLIEAIFLKNKLSEFKGSINFKFYPNISLYDEVDYDEAEKWISANNKNKPKSERQSKEKKD